MTKPKRFSIQVGALALSFCFVALGLVACSALAKSGTPREDPIAESARSMRTPQQHLDAGRELYHIHCVSCHGERGAGDGEVSGFLFPRPRDFASGRFKLVSSRNGAPFDRDLVRTLKRGMPGSAMPAFNWLPPEDLWSLAATVRDLATEGLALRLTGTFSRERGLPAEAVQAEALALARSKMTAVRAIDVPARRENNPVLAARGAELYRERCTACHGPNGEGRPNVPRPNENGQINWARDFTAGYLQGGGRFEDLVYRIAAGMPGTAMPGNDLSPADLVALVAHARSLIPAGAENALVQSRGELLARRVSQLPTDPDDPVWDSAVHLTVILAPLSWSEKAVPAASLAALHDGQQIAIKVAWHDRSNDSGQAFEAGLADACALQFSWADAPPLFGMGTPLNPTIIWHWRAAWPEDFEDLLSKRGVPHGLSARLAEGAVLDAPTYQPTWPQASQEARAYQGSGVGQLDCDMHQPSAQARWSDGSWRVTFARDLDTSPGGLVPGSKLQLAVAIWNGSAGDFGARKATSIWQALELEQ